MHHQLFLSSVDPVEVIVSSSFIPPCSLCVASRVASFVMLCSWIHFLSLICCLDSRGAEGLLGSLFSFDFIFDSRNMLSLVELNTDCLSTVRSHVHNHEAIISVLFVHTCCFSFILSLPLAHPQTSHTRMIKQREISEKEPIRSHRSHLGGWSVSLGT